MKAKAEADKFVRVYGQLRELRRDFSELSSKKPSEAINLFKLARVNEFLGKANLFLETGFEPFESFKQFDQNDIPTNSDVLLVLNQYILSLKKYVLKNSVSEDDDEPRYWVLNGKESQYEVDINYLDLK